MLLRLNCDWQIGDQIGMGGFGKVFLARSETVEHAVAKFVPKAPGSKRELLFVELTGARNVVPVIDWGETADAWVLVMPRASQNLREFISTAERPISVSSVATILLDVATALSDLDGKVVHRDIKPENVLLLNGHWCLADFGISRYAEATTAQDTQKYALSPPYAAPERWRSERATSAADVYALGCIGFELVSNGPPFVGPEMHDFREQHLHSTAPDPIGIAPAFAALIAECLYKAPEARPAPKNIMERLVKITETPSSSGLSRLQAAHLAQVQQRSAAEIGMAARRSATDRKQTLAQDSKRSLNRVITALSEAIEGAAPSAQVFLGSARRGRTIRLADAELIIEEPETAHDAPWGGWEPPAFEVICHASIALKIPRDRYGYEGRSHSLWYCDAKAAGSFLWFETAFMLSPLINRDSRQKPFALAPGIESAKALWNGMSEFQVAWPFTPLDTGFPEEFVDRWAAWLADAAQGTLGIPRSMPERAPQGSWRRE